MQTILNNLMIMNYIFYTNFNKKFGHTQINKDFLNLYSSFLKEYIA